MAPSRRNAQTPSPVRVVVAVAGALAVTAIAVPFLRTSPVPAEDCGDAPCRAALPEPPAPPPAPLSSAATCPTAGYLCAQLEDAPTFQVLRWSSDRAPLRVRVDLPLHEDPARARALRRAAVRGIQAWQGRPFDLAISDRVGHGREAADVHVTWARRLEGVALGTTRARWQDGAGQGTYISVAVVLSTRNPFDGRVALTPDDVTLVAAHEMGHALGLPHSDDPRDLMYPTNTAARLSARDYRTMEALYRLPRGIRIAEDE